MAFTVDYSFNLFYEEINLKDNLREIANKRRDRIVELLKKDFSIIEAFATGSIPKSTALKEVDVDVMVALHYGKHVKDKTPQEVLQEVRDSLSERDMATSTRKNGQAVTLYYKSGPHVDIVPVSRSVNNDDEVTHYNVPNIKIGKWIKSKPKRHSAKIESSASKHGQNFRKIIKMIKWWNLIHGNYLQSYHIEVLAIKVFNNFGELNDLPWYIYQFFEKAKPLLKESLWYSVGYVDNYLTSQKRDELLTRIDTATNKSRDAWLATYDDNNDDKKAIGLWKQIFGSKFPKYGE